MSSEIEKAIGEMVTFMQREVTDVSVEDSQKVVKDIAGKVDIIYKRFFVMMEDLLFDTFTEENDERTPDILKRFLGSSPKWRHISGSKEFTKKESKRFKKGLKPWAEVKSIYNQGRTLGFYHGISSRRKSNRKESFDDYISSLAGQPGAVNRFFGPYSLSFDILKDGRRVTTTVKDGKVTYRREKSVPKEWGVENYEVVGALTFFPNLIGKNFEEREIVAYLATLAGSRARSQFVKIYGSHAFGGPRPLRAIITPLISWHIQKMRAVIEKAL